MAKPSSAPVIEFAGELRLSDGAIESLARLLLGLVDRDQDRGDTITCRDGSPASCLELKFQQPIFVQLLNYF